MQVLINKMLVAARTLLVRMGLLDSEEPTRYSPATGTIVDKATGDVKKIL